MVWCGVVWCGVVWCRTSRRKASVHLDSHRPGFGSSFPHPFISGSSHTSDLKLYNPVATLPGTWRYSFSIEAGWPGVSIL